MHTDLYWYKGLLHLQPLGGTFFVTARLHGSVAQIEKIRLTEQLAERKQQIPAYPGPHQDALDRLGKLSYELIAFTLMPNHIHVTFTLLEDESGGLSSSLVKVVQKLFRPAV